MADDFDWEEGRKEAQIRFTALRARAIAGTAPDANPHKLRYEDFDFVMAAVGDIILGDTAQPFDFEAFEPDPGRLPKIKLKRKSA